MSLLARRGRVLVVALAGRIRRKSRRQQEYNCQYCELLHLKPALKDAPIRPISRGTNVTQITVR